MIIDPEKFFKNQADMNFEQANKCFQEGNFAEAITYYARAYEFNPAHQYALYNRAVSYIQVQNYQTALIDLNCLVNSFPPLAEIYNSRAYTKDKLSDKFGALYDYNKALELKPDLQDAYYNRANLKFELGNIEEAIQDFTEVIKLNLRYSNAYNNRGNCYFYLGKPEAAIANYTKTIELEPNHNQAYNNRGICYGSLGNLQAALRDFEKAAEIYAKNQQTDKHQQMTEFTKSIREALKNNLVQAVKQSISKLKLEH